MGGLGGAGFVKYSVTLRYPRQDFATLVTIKLEASDPEDAEISARLIGEEILPTLAGAEEFTLVSVEET